ncbi:MAG TPA: aminotransferase class V-fold PLP-dependent enzyme [Chloroflexia bacterium]|nr:aminotransferase class V-fold PLP-dependent enzyme [Chloroflexia bacterium]
MKEDFLLRPDMVFLNHGSFGACPRPVFERYQQWQLELEAQPVEFLGRRIYALLEEARAQLANYLNTEADNLVFINNATTGINMVARSLKLDPGDEILATDHEYGAIDRTWRFLCGKSGATYINRTVPLPVTTHEEFVEEFWKGVTPRTRIISISHITSPTALIFPVKEICRRAREAGILTVIDGAHAPGQIPVDLAELGADFYTGNCHKWLCAPKGAAFLYARPEVQHMVEPLVVSWGWESLLPGKSQFIDWHEWQGTRDNSAALTVPDAIAFQAEHDWPAVRARCHELLKNLRQQMNELTGLAPICPDDAGWYAQMATIQLPSCDAKALQSALWQDYRVEVPAMEWKGHQYLRISVQGYNDEQDLAQLLAALRALLPAYSR